MSRDHNLTQFFTRVHFFLRTNENRIGLFNLYSIIIFFPKETFYVNNSNNY